MTTKSDKFRHILFHPVTAWAVLLVSLAITLTAYLFSSSVLENNARAQFEYRTNEIEKAIQDRLHVYEQVLWSGVAYFYSSPNVTRDGFAKFVETLDIERHWPGIQGIGYSIPVAPNEKSAHIRKIRSEGFPRYNISPPGDRNQYSAIIYLEPFDWRNQRAFGYDMWSNDMRREAMKRAIESGEAATSGIITLVQETQKDVQRGFLTYLPVYKSKNIPETVIERKQAFQGWVYAPFRAGDLMEGILGSGDAGLHFRIYDSSTISNQNLLYQSDTKQSFDQWNDNNYFQRRSKVLLQGRPWTIQFRGAKNRGERAYQFLPTAIVIGGLAIDLALFYIIFSLQFLAKKSQEESRKHARSLNTARGDVQMQIDEHTLKLQQEQTELEDKIARQTAELKDKIAELEILNTATMGREERIIELKTEINKLNRELGRKPPYEEIKN